MIHRRIVFAVSLCVLFTPIGAQSQQEAKGAAALSLAQQPLVFEVLHHLVELPREAQRERGCFVIARASSLFATIKALNLDARLWPCHAESASCAGNFGAGLQIFGRLGTERSLATPLRLVVRHLAKRDDVHNIYWVERIGDDTQITCNSRNPESEVWPLFADGTARVTYARKVPFHAQTGHFVEPNDADVVGQSSPVVIDLRHAAVELKVSDATQAGSEAGVCWVHDALPRPFVPPWQSSAIWHVSTQRRRLALTFDACSTYEVGRFNPAVIRALREHRIPATLFVGGHWAEMFPDVLEELGSDDLFELGNHTYSHPHMRDLPAHLQAQELLWTQQLIYTRTGHLPRFFRPPYGEVDDEMLDEVAKAGLVTVEYDLPAGDADVHVSAARLSHWVEGQISPGSVVIMHMNRPGNHTAEALGDIARELRARGYQFCKMSALIDGTEEGCL